MGQSISGAITTTAETASSITKRLVITYYSSVAGIYDGPSNTFIVTGDFPNTSGGIMMDTGGGKTDVIYDDTQVFTKTYGSTASKSFSASLTGIDYWGAGATITTSGSTTIPARAYDAPAAPTSVAISRTSDTQLVVSWDINATATAPYGSQSVQRWDNVTNAWVTIITIGTDYFAAAAGSYTDTTTRANRRYKYRVRADSTGGTATSTESSALQTTPATPTGAAAVKSGSNIALTWADQHSSGMTVTYTVEESQNGGAFASLVTGIAAGAQTYTHVAPSALVTHAYRVKAVSTVGATLSSGYSTSNTVQLAAPPNAPTSLSPSGVALDAVNATPLTWVHNPVDASPQARFQIEHRLTGAPLWTTVIAVVSTASTWTLPASTYANGTSFEWHVRTWGQAITGGSDAMGASVYSSTASVTTSAIPTATISSPVAASTITTSTLALAWAYFDAEGTTQAEWQAELLDGASATVESASGVNADTTYTFATPVADASSYTVKVRVRDGSGLWSDWDSVAFSVSYLPPADVTLAASYDSGVMTITLTPVATDPGVTVDPATVAVQRRIVGGAWITIAAALDPDAVFIDTKCATVGLNEYRAIVTSALPSSVTMTAVSVTTADTRWSYLSYGPAFSIILRCYGNLEFGHADGRDIVLNAFENRPKPVAVFGANTSSTLSVKGDLDSDSTPLVDWRTAAREAETALVRTPAARRDFGAIGGFSASETDPFVTPISFTLTVVDFSG